MSYREETEGQTQDTLERLYLPAGLGAPWDPTGGAGGSGWGEGGLGFLAEAVAPATRTRTGISGRQRDERHAMSSPPISVYIRDNKNTPTIS